MFVYVHNQQGKPLMPTTPPKARILLKRGKAKVVKRTPFTIQLLYGSSGYRQHITLGVDSGYEHIGLSAVTEKQELFSAEVLLRKDVSKLLTERRMYRKTRRSRKTRHRKCRFLNRIEKFKRNPLAPSIQHKLDSHIRIIQKVISILSVTKIVIETANFDIQRIKNPSIRGNQYQKGDQLGFDNVRAYVLHRDGHICQHCKGCSKEPRLNVHHILQRSQGGSDRPDNLITLCKSCHDKLHAGSIQLKVKVTKGFKAETFMSIVKKRLILKLQELCGDVEETFGYITKNTREQLGLVKSHQNDAFAIVGGINQIRSGTQHLVKQVRKQNRKLFKGARSHIRNTASRFIKGFQRYDKVKFLGKIYFILGRRITGRFKLGSIVGKTLKIEPSCKKLKLIESFQTFLCDEWVY
jgi:N6-L-threonylcarbamoyladenine synthase